MKRVKNNIWFIAGVLAIFLVIALLGKSPFFLGSLTGKFWSQEKLVFDTNHLQITKTLNIKEGNVRDAYITFYTEDVPSKLVLIVAGDEYILLRGEKLSTPRTVHFTSALSKINCKSECEIPITFESSSPMTLTIIEAQVLYGQANSARSSTSPQSDRESLTVSTSSKSITLVSGGLLLLLFFLADPLKVFEKSKKKLTRWFK